MTPPSVDFPARVKPEFSGRIRHVNGPRGKRVVSMAEI
jgi:hypothetical protein